MPPESPDFGQVPEGEDAVAYDRLRRRVLWSLPSGLYVVGSRSGEERNLMTCSLAMQLAVTPKIVGVSVERSAVTWGLISAGKCFSLSLVRREDRALVRRFVKPAEHDAATRTLAGVHYEDAPVTGTPIVAAAAAFLDCRLVDELHLGSHTLFAGEVVAAGFGPGGEESDLLRMEDTRMSYGG
jgi:flavin reductase (DIM6/NTAB) family NADH-FMN oxidoreductase RutF